MTTVVEPSTHRPSGPGRIEPSSLRLLLVGNDADYFFMHRLPLARALHGAGYDLHVAIPHLASDARVRAELYPVHRIPLSRGSTNAFRDLRTFVALSSLYRSLRPDLIHHVTLKPTLYGGVAARLCRIGRVVNSVTGLGFAFMSQTRRAALLRSALVPLLRYGCRRPGVRMLFENHEDLETYVELAICDRRASRILASSGITPDCFRNPERDPTADVTVVTVSRMLWDKGIAELVEAARLVRAQRPNVRFVLVGGSDPNPTSIPEPTIRGWQKEGTIEWLGFRNDVPEILSRAHVFCLPSYREGLPRSLMEAAAAGLPAVASDVPGCRDVVEHRVTGLLVPPRDPEALATALLSLVEDPALRQTMGAAAQARARGRYTVDLVVRSTEDVYLDLFREIAAPTPRAFRGVS